RTAIPGTLAIRVFPRLCNVRSTDSHANTNAVAPAATKISGDSWPSNPAATTATDNNTNRPTIYVPSGPTSCNTSFSRSRVRATIITNDTINNADVTTETPDSTAASTAPNDTTATPNGHSRNRANKSATSSTCNLIS